MMTWECAIQDRPVPAQRLGPLLEYDGDVADQQQLSETVARQGYVLLRSVLDRESVLAARQEVFLSLAGVGEIEKPVIEGIGTGRSQRSEQEADLDTFWSAVNQGSRLRSVTHGDPIRDLLSAVMGRPSRAHDLMYLRPMAPGPGTRLHYDLPFFAGYSTSIHTAWIPLGDVAIEEGPLVVVENSNTFSDLLDPIQQIDYQGDRSNETVQAAAYARQNEIHPVDLAVERDVRLLTTEFQAGDLLVFNMLTLHGSLDNQSSVGRVRLSCDVRYQPAEDPHHDPRYFGPRPTGSKGGGYGDMRGAQPLA